MATDAIIRRGPDTCGECATFCDHPKTMGQKIITWKDDDGTEWGKAVSFTLLEVEDANFDTLAYIDQVLLKTFEAWLVEHESQGA